MEASAAGLWWMHHRIKFVGLALCGFALAGNLSISITQGFLALSLLFWLVDLRCVQKYSTSGLYWQNPTVDRFLRAYRYVQWRPIFLAFFAWVILRIIHVAISDEPLKELDQGRELWLLVIVPLVAYRLPSAKWVAGFIFCLVFAGSVTAIYNAFHLAISDVNLLNFRAAAFRSTHHLSFAGTIGPSFFAGLAATAWFYRLGKNKLALIFGLLSFLTLVAFFLGNSRGPLIALFMTFGICLLIALRKKAWFVIPVLLIMPALIYQSSTYVQQHLADSVKDWGSHGSSLEQRVDLWHAGVKIWFDHPVIGVGQAGYDTIYPSYRIEGAIDQAANGSHMHNDLLNTLVLYGAIGATIQLAFFLLPLMAFFAIDAVKRTYRRRPILLFLAGGIILFMTMGLSQCHFTDEEPQMMLWAVVGLLYRFLPREN